MNMYAVRLGLKRSGLRRPLAALVFGVTLAGLMAPAARAQMPGSGPAGTQHMGPHGTSGPDKPALEAPDAIPGSKPRGDAAPSTHAIGDMQPTDALFDAINRGDIASARDALNRGADQSGVNVLGMTPMELSVDLGRNDITFLLLSMRGEDSGRGSRAASHAPDTKTAAPAKVAKAPAPASHAVATIAPAATKPRATPKLFANDGGTPVPSAGFLGFDSRSSAN